MKDKDDKKIKDEKLLKMVNEKNIDLVIEFIENFLCKLQ